MGESSSTAKEIDLGNGFGDVAVKANGIRVEMHADGSVVAYTKSDVDAYTNGAVHVHPAADDSWTIRDKDKIVGEGRVVGVIGAEPQIGAIESTGEHKGEIYGGILPSDNKPIWFSAAPKAMDHFKAAAWATENGGALPTRKQGDYLTTLKGKGGAFTEIFNRGGSFPAGYVWLAEPSTSNRNYAWCQEVRSGDQLNHGDRDTELPVLCVVR